jgi:hypothetical protein
MVQKCTVDSAFGNVSREFLIKSCQELIHIKDCAERGIAHDATSMRQSAEWGMRAFQSSMPRLKDHMKFETCGEWRVILTMMILLYSLQARAVGINQLTSFYTAPLNCDANIEFVVPLINNYYYCNHYCLLFAFPFVSFILLLLIVSVTVVAKTLLLLLAICHIYHIHQQNRHPVLSLVHLLTLQLHLQTKFFASLLLLLLLLVPVQRLIHHHHHHNVTHPVTRRVRTIPLLSCPRL